MARATGNASAREASLLPVVLALILIVVLAILTVAVGPRILHLSHSVDTHLNSSPAAGH